MRRLAAGILLAALLLPGCAAAEPQPDPAAERAIARTKAPTSDYSLFLWTVVRVDGEEVSSWAAEFHRGSLHRVETPFVTIVADCETMTGHHHSLTPDIKLSSREAAETACGIDMPGASAVTYMGSISSGYGKVDMVALTKGGLRRSYWVDRTGVLIQSQFAKLAEPEQWVLRNWATHIDRGSPDPDMFTAASLTTSFVPEERRIQSKPAHDIGFDVDPG